ncbi:MAG: type II toxin-antitoxin system RelE/ParE family toxin [Methylobacter sp.]
MNVLFHPDAETELNAAIDYYEDIEKGLGYDFSLEVLSALERIIAFPKAWTFIEDGVRRSLVRRFPYGILYAEEKDKIYIVAVMHLHRDPEYWKHKI